MKTYTITVNGTAYDVTVEETAGGAAPAPAAKAAPAAPAAAPAPAPAPAKAAGGAGGSHPETDPAHPPCGTSPGH